MQQLRIVALGTSGGRSLTGPFRDVGVWDVSIIQGPVSVAPCRTRCVTFDSQLLHRCTAGEREQLDLHSPRHGASSEEVV
jgi:hypothetical protein